MELHMKLVVVGLVMSGGTFLFGFLGFETIVEFVVKDQASLRKRNIVRGIYLNIPLPLDFKFYFFNVTNPMEVQNGAKPILKEVGPYCYEEYKTKINVVDNDGEDSLQYDSFDTYIFNQKCSGNLSDEDYVTILHPILVAMVNKVSEDAPQLLNIVTQAMDTLFRNPKSIYLTDKVKNILFDGMELNCEGINFAVKAICVELRTLVPGIRESPTQKNVLLFGIMRSRNATIADVIKIKRGIRNYREVGKVLEANGKKKLNIWSTHECNHFKGTDGWIIPPLLKPENGIQAYSPLICRNVDVHYVRDDVIKGISVRRYEANFGDQTNNEEDKCYCPTPKTCLRKGLYSLNKCLRVPVFLSLPHFLGADEIFLKQVEGLNPKYNDHVIHVDIEHMTSAPLEVRIRAQINFEIGPNPKVPLMKNLPVALHPVLWLEDGLLLHGPSYTEIYLILLLLKAVLIIRWIIIVPSLVVLTYGYYLRYKNQEIVKITPIHHSHSSKESSMSSFRSSHSQNKFTGGTENTKNEQRNNNVVKNILSGHEFEKYS